MHALEDTTVTLLHGLMQCVSSLLKSIDNLWVTTSLRLLKYTPPLISLLGLLAHTQLRSELSGAMSPAAPRPNEVGAGCRSGTCSRRPASSLLRAFERTADGRPLAWYDFGRRKKM